MGETIVVGYRELVHRFLPILSHPAPIGRDVMQRQPDQLAGRIVIWEVP